MKTMKRFASVLLAAVLALAMLTACGGGGSSTSSFGKQVEDAYIAAVNKARGEENGTLTNDSELREKALAKLNTIDKDGNITKENAYKMEDISYTEDGKKVNVTIIQVATESTPVSENVYRAKAVTAKDLDELINGDMSDAAESMKMVNKMGIATITRGDKTYVAMAMQIAVDPSQVG